MHGRKEAVETSLNRVNNIYYTVWQNFVGLIGVMKKNATENEKKIYRM